MANGETTGILPDRIAQRLEGMEYISKLNSCIRFCGSLDDKISVTSNSG